MRLPRFLEETCLAVWSLCAGPEDEPGLGVVPVLLKPVEVQFTDFNVSMSDNQ